jgi:hypothetical protein
VILPSGEALGLFGICGVSGLEYPLNPEYAQSGEALVFFGFCGVSGLKYPLSMLNNRTCCAAGRSKMFIQSSLQEAATL